MMRGQRRKSTAHKNPARGVPQPKAWADRTPSGEWCEGEFTKWLTAVLERDGAVVVPILGTMMQRNWPDRLVYHRRWHGLCELKRLIHDVTPGQHKNLEKLRRRRPGNAVVLRCGEVYCTCEDQDKNVLFRFTDAKTLIDGLVELERLGNEATHATGSLEEAAGEGES